MHKNYFFDRYIIRRTAASVSLFLMLGVCAWAGESAGPDGRWIGSSILEGRRASAEKTILSIESGTATLNIEGGSICTLGEGSYSPVDNIDGVPAWNFSFKTVNGGDDCRRLGQGIFSVHRGAKLRTLDFEANYSGRDGEQTRRLASLTHYP